jgi:hypothetical protein
MTTIKVHRFKVYDAVNDEYRRSSRMGTREQINLIGVIIPGTEREIDVSLVTDGLTEKNFPDEAVMQTAEDRAREDAAAETPIFPDT